jgi:hypothetical protein
MIYCTETVDTRFSEYANRVHARHLIGFLVIEVVALTRLLGLGLVPIFDPLFQYVCVTSRDIEVIVPL